MNLPPAFLEKWKEIMKEIENHSKYSCPICFEHADDMIELVHINAGVKKRKGHCMCTDCHNKWKKPTCPFCRDEIELDSFYPRKVAGTVPFTRLTQVNHLDRFPESVRRIVSGMSGFAFSS